MLYICRLLNRVQFVVRIKEKYVNHTTIAYHEIDARISLPCLTRSLSSLAIWVKSEMEYQRICLCNPCVDSIEKLSYISTNVCTVEVRPIITMFDNVVDRKSGGLFHPLEIKICLITHEWLVEMTGCPTKVYFVILNSNKTILRLFQVAPIEFVCQSSHNALGLFNIKFGKVNSHYRFALFRS